LDSKLLRSSSEIYSISHEAGQISSIYNLNSSTKNSTHFLILRGVGYWLFGAIQKR
jgi:hypothetical protein